MLGTIGLYRHDLAEPFTEEDEAFAMDIGVRAGLVLENARLFEQLAASLGRLEELSQRMVQLAERERRAIALELHDEVGQGLTAARLLLQAARRQRIQQALAHRIAGRQARQQEVQRRRPPRPPRSRAGDSTRRSNDSRHSSRASRRWSSAGSSGVSPRPKHPKPLASPFARCSGTG